MHFLVGVYFQILFEKAVSQRRQIPFCSIEKVKTPSPLNTGSFARTIHVARYLSFASLPSSAGEKFMNTCNLWLVIREHDLNSFCIIASGNCILILESP